MTIFNGIRSEVPDSGRVIYKCWLQYLSTSGFWQYIFLGGPCSSRWIINLDLSSNQWGEYRQISIFWILTWGWIILWHLVGNAWINPFQKPLYNIFIWHFMYTQFLVFLFLIRCFWIFYCNLVQIQTVLKSSLVWACLEILIH